MSVFERGSAELKRIAEKGRAAAGRALERAAETSSSIQATRTAPLENVGPEPPVVARLIVEIRSDGSRTIARGGLEDLATGEKVAIRADGTSPAQLARSLAGSLLTLPLFAARMARSLKRGEGAAPTEDELRDPSDTHDEK
jgi:hypothetical protein